MRQEVEDRIVKGLCRVWPLAYVLLVLFIGVIVFLSLLLVGYDEGRGDIINRTVLQSWKKEGSQVE